MVKPGIIDTSMAHRIGATPKSAYPHANRIATRFKTTLETAPVPPSLVADKILEVAQSDSWQLRLLVGPDAVGLIEWRKGMSDEEWVDLHAADDEDFGRRMGAAAAN